MRVGLLGPIELRGANGPVPLGGPKERAVLAFLALHANDSVSTATLVDAVWPDDPPRTAQRTLQGYLSRLRRALDRAEPGGAALLESHPMSTRLRLPPGALDAVHVADLVARAAAAREAGEHVDAALTLADALRSWRGEPLAELYHLPWAAAAGARFAELRLHVLEERIDAELAAGRAGELVAELEALCRAHPLRERLWGQRMVALYRAGRQAEALRSFQAVREHLRDELGLEPGPALVDLEERILAQDPSLRAAAPVSKTSAEPTVRTSTFPATLRRLRDSDFVGREKELTSLDETWRRVCAGESAVLLLSGEPGIGKTALAAEHAASVEAAGARVLFGRCDEESLVPFQPFVEAITEVIEGTDPDVLRTLVDERAADLALLVPALERRLPELTVDRTGAETERYRMFEAVPALFGTMAASAPVLFVIDDLHWAERPTLQLLQHLARHGSVERLLVVGTYRDTDLSRSHPLAEFLGELRRGRLVSRLPVRGLHERDVVTMVTAGAEPDERDRTLASSLWQESEGSPLFLREILRHLEESGVVAADEAGKRRALRPIRDLGLPEGIREVIGRRLSRLSDDANLALRIGSVMGSDVRIDVISEVSDLDADAVLDALEEATAAGLVTEQPSTPGTYAFSHALVRQALYAELSLTRRVRLHERIGDALVRLGGESHLAEIAHHYAQSAVTDPDRAIDHAVRAAAAAKEAVAYEDAARLLEEAVEVSRESDGDVGRRADMLLQVSDLAWSFGDPERARTACDHVIALVGEDDPERYARAALGLAGGSTRAIWVQMGTPNERAVHHLERALDLLPESDSLLRARVLAILARELHFRASSDRGRTVFSTQALEMARRLGDDETLAQVLCASMLATYSPDTARSRADGGAEAGELARRLGDVQLRGHACMHRFQALAELCELEEAARELAAGEALLKRLRDPVAAYLVPAYHGGAATLQGRIAEGYDLLRESFRQGHERRDPNAIIVYGGGVIVSYLYQRRYDELLGPLHQLIGAFPLMASTGFAIEATIAAESGDLVRARHALEKIDARDPDSLRRDPFFLLATYCMARGAWLLEDSARGELFDELLEPYGGLFAGIASVGFGPMHTARGWASAAAGRLDDADRHFDDALAVADRHGWRTVRTEVLLHRAVNRRERGDDEASWLPLLDESHSLATELGLDGIAREAEAARTGDRPERLPARATRFQRAKARLTGHARNALAALVKDDDDEALARRFSTPLAQRAVFTALTAAYQPSMALGFRGEIEIELRGIDPIDPTLDVWTIEIGEAGAKAEPRCARRADLTLRATIPDFIRIGTGALSPTKGILESVVEVDGDAVFAARLPYLFGAEGG